MTVHVDDFMPNRDPRLAHIVARIPSGWGRWIQVGPGWHELVLELDRQLTALVPDYELHQCKEKFGGLRYYVGAVPADKSDAVYALIDAAEARSESICEQCGGAGRPEERQGWITTLCDGCRERR